MCITALSCNSSMISIDVHASGVCYSIGTASSFHPWTTRSDAVATLVSDEADRGSTEASNEGDEEERSVRFDDTAALEDYGLHVVFILDTAEIVALNLRATTAQEIAGSWTVRLRVATVGAGDLDCVGLIALLAAALLHWRRSHGLTTTPPASRRTEAKMSTIDMMRAGMAETQMEAMPMRLMSRVKPPANAA
jgi:hypothetical protein